MLWLVCIVVTMPGMCSVPGCKGYKKARSRGVVFHSLPTRDPGRCRQWLKAIQNPKFNENTPVSKYGNIRVCSQHFKPEDYEADIQAELMKTTPRKILKSNVIPTVFSGRQHEDLCTSIPADDSSRRETNAPSTAAQAATSVVSGTSVLRWASVLTSGPSTSSQPCSMGDTASPSPPLPIPISPRTSSQSSPPVELGESLHSVDNLNESQETEFNMTATSKPDDNTEKDLSQSKTIVNDSCLMELFKKCQTCGQPITKKMVSHCGAQKKVRWSCTGGHRGIWMSSPHLWEAFPEIHLLTSLSVLFSGGAFTLFKKWAKHLHLHFMGHKTFFEIQKAYLNPEVKPMNRTEQEGIFAKAAHQQPEGTLPHISDPLKKIKAKSRRRKKGVPSSWSSYEKRSSVSLTSTGTCMQESTTPSCLGHISASERGKKHQQDDVEHQSETTHMASEVDWLQDSFEEMEVTIDEDECNSVKNRLSDLESDVENVVETAELSDAGAEDSCDEDVYVPVIPQRSTTSELLLECEEEELEPWQKQTSHVHLKDDGELSDDQTDHKPEPSLVQRNADFIVASSNYEFIGSLETQCCAGNSFTIVPAAQQQLFQKVATATVKSEAHVGAHTSEVHQLSINPVCFSSVHSPAVHATSSAQLQSDQANSQTLSAPSARPCFTVHELESTGTSNKQ